MNNNDHNELLIIIQYHIPYLMWSAILLAGIRSPVIGEIKNCSLAGCTVAVGLAAEGKTKHSEHALLYEINKMEPSIIVSLLLTFMGLYFCGI